MTRHAAKQYNIKNKHNVAPSHLIFRVDLLHCSHLGYCTFIRHDHIWTTTVVHQSNTTTKRQSITIKYFIYFGQGSGFDF